MTDITNKNNTDQADKKKAAQAQRERRERGPPADGIPSKTKVMVANLPYDLTEEKVSRLATLSGNWPFSNVNCSFSNFSRTTPLPPPRSRFVPFLAS